MRDTTTLPVTQRSAGNPWDGAKGNWDASSKPKTIIVLHTMVGYLVGTDATFANPESKAAANYGIGLNGEIHQYVKENETAYHSGVYGINQISIGIEHEDNNNPTDSVRTPELYKASAELVADISRAWGIPLDRQHIKKHNEIKATSCPGGLDIDKIILMAQELVKQPQTEPGSAQNTMTITDDEARAVQVLREAFAKLKTKEGTPYGNIEGLTRDVVEIQPRYEDLIRPDAGGNPPVVIAHDHFVDLTIKGNNLDKVAAYFGYTEINEVDPTLGDKVVETIKILSQKDPNTVAKPVIPTVPVTNNPDQMGQVFAQTGTGTPVAPNSDQATVSLSGSTNFIKSFFGIFASMYASMFLPKGGVK